MTEIPIDLLEGDCDYAPTPTNKVATINNNANQLSNPIKAEVGLVIQQKPNEIAYFKCTTDLSQCIGNPSIHSIYLTEKIFSLKVKGVVSKAIISTHFGIGQVTHIANPSKVLGDSKPDFLNENARVFIMKDKTTAYIKGLELVNGFLDYVNLKQGKMRAEFYTLLEIDKIVKLINRYFEKYDADEFVDRLLLLANIEGIDKLTILQDNPRKQDVSFLNKLKKVFIFWGYNIEMPIYVMSSKGFPCIDNIQFIRWLNINGFFNHFITEDISITVRIVDNKANVVSMDRLISWITETLQNGDTNSYTAFMNCPQRTIVNAVLKTLPTIKDIGLKDTRNECYKAYLNGICKVTKDDIKLIPYKESDFVIWQNEIIQRYLNPNISWETVLKSKFARFFDKAVGMDNLYLLGYLSHRYKDWTLAKIVVFTDANPSEREDEANGRSGKSLLINALSYFNKVVEIDHLGKDKFDLQNVEPYHGIVAFPDAPFAFNIRSLFNATTGTMATEKKTKDRVLIQFKDSPKILVATNHKLKMNNGDSYTDRLAMLHFTDFFNISNRPVNYLGGMLFEDEWNEFDMFFLNACKTWLNVYSFDKVKQSHLDKLSWIKVGIEVTKFDLEQRLRNIPDESYREYLKTNKLKEVMKRSKISKVYTPPIPPDLLGDDCDNNANSFLTNNEKFIDKKTLKISWKKTN
jgi:hypothetical protein